MHTLWLVSVMPSRRFFFRPPGSLRSCLLRFCNNGICRMVGVCRRIYPAALRLSGVSPSPSSTCAAMADVSLDDTFGALVLGTFFSLMLYGVNLHQVCDYVRMFPSDMVYLKATVLVIFSAATVCSILYIHMSYHYLVMNYANPLGLLSTTWSLDAMTPPITLTIFMAQCFYARRVYIMGSNFMRKLLIPVALCSLGAVGFGIAVSYSVIKYPHFADWKPRTWLSSAGFAFAAATDIMLTSMTVIILKRRCPAFKNTETLLNVLVMYTINTGLFTRYRTVTIHHSHTSSYNKTFPGSTLASASFLLAIIRSDDMIFIAINMSMAQSYVTSVLAVLNSRQSLLVMMNAQPQFDTFHMSVVQSQRPSAAPKGHPVDTLKFARGLGTSKATIGIDDSAGEPVRLCTSV
ncbi:hypothetical protein C8Q76DRAFT_854320 [Earliella scabrosa]|nr:hypothetical protein C8Q76DRAFT_854320 [Earliella scabrosa]